MNIKTTTGLIIILIIVIIGFVYLNLGEEDSELAQLAKNYCDEMNVSSVQISEEAGMIKVTSTLLGGGSTYYSMGGEPIHCPVVGPDSITRECGEILEIENWTNICDNTDVSTEETAEMVGFNFIQDFIRIAPPESDLDAKERILSVLSKNAKERVKEESALSDLALFVKVQDVPDQGVSVEDLKIEGEGAILTVGLNYSGGRALRNIHLLVEDGEWKVDEISIPEEYSNFEAEGNLVRNNPGMKEGVWHLIYEEPGSPALSKELKFSTSSICAEGVENNECRANLFEEGQRVKILGFEVEEGVVEVIRLEIKE